MQKPIQGAKLCIGLCYLKDLMEYGALAMLSGERSMDT